MSLLILIESYHQTTLDPGYLSHALRADTNQEITQTHYCTSRLESALVRLPRAGQHLELSIATPGATVRFLNESSMIAKRSAIKTHDLNHACFRCAASAPAQQLRLLRRHCEECVCFVFPANKHAQCADAKGGSTTSAGGVTSFISFFFAAMMPSKLHNESDLCPIEW